MFGYCGGVRAVSLFVNTYAMFVEADFKSAFGFSYVLFVTVALAATGKFKARRDKTNSRHVATN